MRIAEHVVRRWFRRDGRPDPKGSIAVWGWSDRSVEDAIALAFDRAARITAALRASEPLERSYYPLDRPILEPVVQWLDDERRGALTRNGYGAVVLNHARVLFADLDLPSPPPRPAPTFRWPWQKAPPPPPDLQEEVVARVVQVCEARGLGLRLYRTAGGLRGLVTSRTFSAVEGEGVDFLREIGSDPLYVRLTEVQQCFRARLTPKPWRIGLYSPQTHAWPWRGEPERQRRFEDWDARYVAASASRSVCEPVRTIGPDGVDPVVAPILALHDAWTCTGRPLA